ncbi:MAG: hypothetical protein BYD32DRAFT_450985 [Podila humilis]|nr:MAG: hypothetical protein BYD32DRAFT_450985 [Podila humilis]
MAVIKIVKEEDQTSDHEGSDPERVSNDSRSRATTTSPTSSSSRKSESFESSDFDMDEFTLIMGRNTLSDEANSPGTTPIDPRIKSDKPDGCQGYTVEGRLCNSKGEEVVKFENGIGHYCFQHNPTRKDQRCHAYKSRGREQCAIICSFNAREFRDGRPICNVHHEWGAQLIDGSSYPPHRP